MKPKFPLMALLLLFLMLPLGLVQAEARVPGVRVGDTIVYDHWILETHSVITETILSVVGGNITYSWVQEFDNGGKLSLTRWTNVDSQVIVVGNSTDFTPTGYPHMFIGTNLPGGSVEYAGSVVPLTASFFGKILLGNWRATLFWKVTNRLYEYSNYMEWDKVTGILTEQSVTFSGIGETLKLKTTSLWTSDWFWTGVETVGVGVGMVLPYIVWAFFLWVMSFMVVGLGDWLHVRKIRAKTKAPSATWGQIKMLVIAMLIVMAILYIFFFLLSVVLQGIFR